MITHTIKNKQTENRIRMKLKRKKQSHVTKENTHGRFSIK